MYVRRFYQVVVRLIVAAIFLGCLADAWAVVSVKGYYRKNGTYVAPHHRSNPDGNFGNNWSTAGNVNPYTGKVGTLRKPPSNYGSDVSVRGYTRRNGTYVAPHMRSAPDGSVSNNWSARGNVNPYSGEIGSDSTAPPRTYRTAAVAASVDFGSEFENVTPSTSELAADYDFSREREESEWDQQKLAHPEPVDVRKTLTEDELSQHSRLTSDLKQSGVNLTWQLYTPQRLNSMADRMAAAERIKSLGLEIPWQMRTVEQLETLEQQLLAAEGTERQRIIEENKGVEGLWWQLDRSPDHGY